MSTWLGTVKRGHGRANADEEWRTADEAFKKKNRMFILLNLLVNCHFLRNASFGYFFFFFFLLI